MPFNQPGIVTIPLGFVVLIVVSLLTHRTGRRAIPAVTTDTTLATADSNA